MTYRVVVWEDAQRDLAALPRRKLRPAALGVALALRDNLWLGEPLPNRLGTAALTGCRRVTIDRADLDGKPRYHLIYRVDVEDSSIVVQVISLGLRGQVGAYLAAASMEGELKKRVEEARNPSKDSPAA